MEIRIEKARLEDAGEIARLNEQAFHYGTSISETVQLLERILSISGELVLVARGKSGLCGYLHMSDYATTYRPILKDIRTLAVDENARGQGIGRQLLRAAEDAAKTMGAEGVRLVSGWDREGAHAFYLRLGYRDRKDQKNFIKLLSTTGKDEE